MQRLFRCHSSSMSLFTTFVACCFVMCMAILSLPIDKGASLSDRISIL